MRKDDLLYQWHCNLPQMQWTLSLDRAVPEDCCGTGLYQSDNAMVLIKANVTTEGLTVYGVPSPPIATLQLGVHQGVPPLAEDHMETEALALASRKASIEEDKALAMQLDDMYSNSADDEADEILESLDSPRRERIAMLLELDDIDEADSLLGESVPAQAIVPQHKPSGCLSSMLVVHCRDRFGGEYLLQRSRSSKQLLRCSSDDGSNPTNEILRAAEVTIAGGQNMLHLMAQRGGENPTAMCASVVSQVPENMLCSLLTTRDQAGKTPFFVALEHHDIQMAAAILAVALKAQTEDLSAALCTPDLWGNPPLHALLGLCNTPSIENAKELPTVSTPEGAPALATARHLLQELAQHDALVGKAHELPILLLYLRQANSGSELLATACAGVPALVADAVEYANGSPTEMDFLAYEVV